MDMGLILSDITVKKQLKKMRGREEERGRPMSESY